MLINTQIIANNNRVISAFRIKGINPVRNDCFCKNHLVDAKNYPWLNIRRTK